MKKEMLMKVLAAKTEWHWLCIRQARKSINRLIDSGEPLTSEKLAEAGSRVEHHGLKAMDAQYRYEQLAGLQFSQGGKDSFAKGA